MGPGGLSAASSDDELQRDGAQDDSDEGGDGDGDGGPEDSEAEEEEEDEDEDEEAGADVFNPQEGFPSVGRGKGDLGDDDDAQGGKGKKKSKSGGFESMGFRHRFPKVTRKSVFFFCVFTLF